MKNFLIIFLFLSFFLCLPVLAEDASRTTVDLENPIQKKFEINSPQQLIGYVLKAGLGLVGGITLVMMVYGGFQWLTAAGKEEKIKNGTQTMLWAAIGLVLVFSSYLIMSTVFQIFNL